MNILAIETATDVCSVALAVDGKIADIQSLRRARSHSERLAPMIVDCLNAGGLASGELDVVAVSAGPGSYTGLRIGTSTAKGIVFGTDAKLVAVSTLEAMAQPFLSRHTGPVISVLPSRRGEIYMAAFQRSKENGMDRLLDECIVSMDQLADKLNEYRIHSGLFVLQGPPEGTCRSDEAIDATLPDAYGGRLFDSLKMHDVRANFLLSETAVSAEEVAICSISRVEKHLFEDASDFEPYYLRAFEARKPGRSIFDRLPF